MMCRALIIAVFLFSACQGGEKDSAILEHEGLRYLPLQTERLPDMPSPRTGHVLLPFGDGFMAVGGHTTGFVPVAQADIFHSGKWTTVPTLYPHDTPFGLTLKDGRIVIGGGYAECFGIGQSWGVECFDPETWQFSPLPILGRKRAHASALEMSGNLIISGNWWAPDDVEQYCFDDYKRSASLLPEGRSYPFILRSDIDNALIFSAYTEYCKPASPVVDRLKGGSFEVPLLKEWIPYASINHGPYPEGGFIGDMSTGRFSYLVHVTDTSRSHSALVTVNGENFSLLKTEQPIPSEGPWGAIQYVDYAHVDRSSRIAWLLGVDDSLRFYLAGVDYASEKPCVSMYYTEPILEVGRTPNARLLPDGRIVLCGGLGESNYEPFGGVYVLSPVKISVSQGFPAWAGLLIGAFILLGAGIVYGKRRSVAKASPAPAAPPSMAQRIDSLMRERQFFRKPDLRLADVAHELGTNSTYVSACINSENGVSFPDYVAGFRVRYAQELLRMDSDKTMAEIAAESGFSNEKSFLRTFKAQTGLTPSQVRDSRS